MSTVREFLKGMLTRSAEHHVAMAKAHSTAMEQCDDAAQSKFHKSMMETHLAAGTADAEDARACAKAETDSDLNKIAPDAVSSIYREDNTEHLRMVPRPGAPDGPQKDVEPVFAKLVSIEDEA